MEFLIVVLFVYMVWSHNALSARIKKIEQSRTDAPESSSVSYTAPQAVMAQTMPLQHKPPVPTTVDSYRDTKVPVQDLYQASTEPEQEEMFLAWIKKDFLMKVGALFLIMAFGWFVNYAFEHNLISPTGRILLGIGVGVCTMALGALRIRVYEHQGAVLTVLGSTILLISVTAGRELYGLFSPFSSLTLILLAVVFVAFVSLKYNRNSLALASLILAMLSPWFSDIDSLGLHTHALYALVITLGTLWVVYYTGWRNLTFTALVFVFFILTSYMPYEYETLAPERAWALAWAFIFTAIFFVANIVSLIRQEGGVMSPTNLFTALGTAFALIMWVSIAGTEETRSLLLTSWALVFAVGAYFVVRVTSFKGPFYVYGGTAVALIGAALVAEFEGAVLTLALLFLVALTVLAGSLLKLEVGAIRIIAYTFVIPLIMTFENMYASAWRTSVFHEHFFVLFVTMLVMGIIGLFLYERHYDPDKGPHELQLGTISMIVGSCYGLILLWLVPHALFFMNEDIGTTVSLFIYTVLGVALYMKGKATHKDVWRIPGICLLTFVVLRLLFVDVWEMELGARIVTFMVIGVILISTAFMRRTHHN